MKRVKKSIWVILASVIVLSTATLLCNAAGVFDKNNNPTKDFDKNNPETWLDDAKNGGIRCDDAKRIKAGMTFEETVGIIGKPQRDVGSGVVAMEWDINTGEVLYICFNKVPSTEEETERYLTTGKDEINLMSYHVEIKND